MDGKIERNRSVMNYLTFLLRDPETKKIKSVGVKYKAQDFTNSDLEKMKKKGTANHEVRVWIKSLRDKNLFPEIEILYNGTDSAVACHAKQQYIINHKNEDSDIIGVKISTKKYTKRLRTNEDTRNPIIDQFGTVYPGVLEAAEKLLLAPSNISKVLHGKLEHIGGYKFKFHED